MLRFNILEKMCAIIPLHRTNVDAQKELKNCTFVKTMLMLLVVFYHSIVFWKGNWFTENPVQTSKLLAQLSAWLNSFHIYAFTMISGYIFYYIKFEKGEYSNYCCFLINKVKRLLVPYILVAFFWVIPLEKCFFEFSINDLVNDYILARSPHQLWFLFMLFDVFAIFWPLSNWIRKHDFLGCCLVAILYGTSLLIFTVIPSVFMIGTALKYLPFFLLGFKLRQHGSGVVRKIPVVMWLVVDFAFFAAVRYLGRFDTIMIKIIKLFLGFVLNMVGSLMAFVILQRIADKVKRKQTPIMYLSKYSMVIFLLHQQIIYFFISGLNGKVDPYLNALINFVGATGISLLIGLILMRFRVTRYMIGEK